MQDELYRQAMYYVLMGFSMIAGLRAILMVLGKQWPRQTRDMLIIGLVLTFIVSIPLGLVYFVNNVKGITMFSIKLPTLTVANVPGVIGIILLARGYQKARQHAKGGASWQQHT